tara:strand:+ start:245 stop:709 length:465 start_codon:yes stop_codon:yes gene_type:complete
MIKINVISNNKSWKKYLRNPNSYFDKKTKLLNKKSKLYKNKRLICSLLLSDSPYIKKLNKKFRNKNKSTDVLSFPFYEKRKLKNVLKNNKEIYLGDIIINLSKVKNKNDKKNFKLELNKLWIHGLVHLFGYKHKLKKDFNSMSKIEEKYFRYIS